MITENNYSTNNNQSLKTVLCAVVKNENHYIRKWVEYYRSIDINKIIYNNNDLNEKRFEKVIKNI